MFHCNFHLLQTKRPCCCYLQLSNGDKGDFHVGLTLGVFTRCYSHHHGYFLFLHLIICLNSVGDRDGEMGNESELNGLRFGFENRIKKNLWRKEKDVGLWNPSFLSFQGVFPKVSHFLSLKRSFRLSTKATLFFFLCLSFLPPLSLILSKLSLLTVLAQTIRPCIQILQLMSHENILFIPFHILLRSSS